MAAPDTPPGGGRRTLVLAGYGMVGHRLDEAGRIDDQFLVRKSQPRLGKGRGVEQIETLTCDRKNAERCPYVPGAQTA